MFDAIKLIKDSDAATISEYKYSGYIISFYSKKTFLHSDKKTWARNVMIFCCDLSDSIRNKRNRILLLRENDVEIGKTTIHAEQPLLKIITVHNKKFVLSLHYNEDNSYLFVNGEKFIKFK